MFADISTFLDYFVSTLILVCILKILFSLFLIPLVGILCFDVNVLLTLLLDRVFSPVNGVAGGRLISVFFSLEGLYP